MVDIRYLPDLGDLPLLNHRAGEIAGLYTLDISRSPMQGSARIIKRLEDLLLGVSITLLVLPICAVIAVAVRRSEEHTSELQSLMRISYAVFCLKKKTNK